MIMQSANDQWRDWCWVITFIYTVLMFRLICVQFTNTLFRTVTRDLSAVMMNELSIVMYYFGRKKVDPALTRVPSPRFDLR
jgi:hypothetical protein